MMHWLWLPATALYPLPVADSRSPLSSVTLRFEDDLKIDANLGADFPVVQLDAGALRAGLGVAAVGSMGFQPNGSLTFELQTFDGTFAFPLDAAWGPMRARLQWAHTSAHFADGVRNDPEHIGNRATFSREWLQLQVAGLLGPATLYGGGRVLLHAESEPNPLGAQVGAEVVGPWVVAPYAAVDLQLYGEQEWQPRLAGQVGAAVRVGHNRFRLAFVARYGVEDTGQLYDEDKQYLGMVFGFDRTGAISAPEKKAPAGGSQGGPVEAGQPGEHP